MENIKEELKKENFDISIFENNADVLEVLVKEFDYHKMEAINNQKFESAAFWRDRERTAIELLKKLSI